jgi:RNA 3'-terminal phosphate cyclase
MTTDIRLHGEIFHGDEKYVINEISVTEDGTLVRIKGLHVPSLTPEQKLAKAEEVLAKIRRDCEEYAKERDGTLMTSYGDGVALQAQCTINILKNNGY